MFRLMFWLVLALAFVVLGSTVQLGKRTFFGHVRAIWATEEVQDAKDGIQEKAGPALDEVGKRAGPTLDKMERAGKKALEEMTKEEREAVEQRARDEAKEKVKAKVEEKARPLPPPKGAGAKW